VSDLDKERPYAIPLVRPLPIPHLHDWRKMEVCLNTNVDNKCVKTCIIQKMIRDVSMVKAKMMRGVKNSAIFWNGVQLCKWNYWKVFKKVQYAITA
jgi:hypothetical protein